MPLKCDYFVYTCQNKLKLIWRLQYSRSMNWDYRELAGPAGERTQPRIEIQNATPPNTRGRWRQKVRVEEGERTETPRGGRADQRVAEREGGRITRRWRYNIGRAGRGARVWKAGAACCAAGPHRGRKPSTSGSAPAPQHAERG